MFREKGECGRGDDQNLPPIVVPSVDELRRMSRDGGSAKKKEVAGMLIREGK